MERACDDGLVEDYAISQSSLEQARFRSDECS